MSDYLRIHRLMADKYLQIFQQKNGFGNLAKKRIWQCCKLCNHASVVPPAAVFVVAAVVVVARN